MPALLVLTNCPDPASAQTIARAVIDSRAAACVNILSPCQSIYRWQGEIESAVEIPLLIKSTAASYPALEAAIRAVHPYDVPEIIALPISHGLPAYLDWLAETTAPG